MLKTETASSKRADDHREAASAFTSKTPPRPDAYESKPNTDAQHEENESVILPRVNEPAAAPVTRRQCFCSPSVSRSQSSDPVSRTASARACPDPVTILARLLSIHRCAWT